MSKLKTKINDAISEHIDTGNSYTYQLIRTKEAFQYGTVTLDDFIEWDDDAVEELSNDIMKALQPKLNENQEIVLEWLKGQKSEHVVKPSVLFYQLTCRNSLITTKEVLEAFDKLTDEQELQVFQYYTTWALDQC